MAKLKVLVGHIEGEKEFSVVIDFTNDVPKDDILKLLGEFFEIEMMSSEIKMNKKNTLISLVTTNSEKVQILKSGMVRAFRNGSNIGEINNN